MKYPLLFLRIAVAFPFLYSAISSLINPDSWVGFIPLFIQNLFNPYLILTLFSIFEIVLGLWILSNKLTYYAALTSTILLFIITITNLGALEIVYRDIGLWLASISLTLLSRKR